MINNFNIDVIIVDDGFQHRSLYRDLDIVLINSKDTLQTHRLIPVGLLRERLKNLKRADLLVFTKTNIHDKNDYIFKKFNNAIFGSHNAFNTKEAVNRTNDDCVLNLIKALKN